MSVPIDVLAHRGCAVAHRENTTAAFAEAVRVGADGIELDVRSSADGRLVVHHDPLLPDGRVVGRTHSTAFPDYVPLLGEALDACDGLLVNVEVKSDPSEPGFVAGEATARATAQALAARSRGSAGGPFVVSSFSLSALDTAAEVLADEEVVAPSPGIARREHSRIELALLVSSTEADVARALGTVVARGWQALHPHFALVDEGLAGRAAEAGIPLRAWTVDDPEEVRRLRTLGVAAILTDDVAMARSVLGRS